MEKELFFDAVLIEKGEERSITYRSGLTVYEEGFFQGQYLAYGWNGAGYVPQVVNNPPRLTHNLFAFPMAFLVEADGQLLHSHLHWKGFAKEPCANGLLVTVCLEHTLFPVEISVHTLLDGTPILTRWLTIRNLSEQQPVALSKIDVMCGGLQITKQYRNLLRQRSALYRVGYMAESMWGREGSFQWKELDGNCGTSISGRLLRDRFRHPMFVLENKGTGECFIGQLGYSGGYRFDFELDQDVYDARMSFRVSLDGYAPLRVLDPSEKTETPRMHMGMLFGGLDNCVNAMHRHVRTSVFTRPYPIKAPVRGGIGPEMDMSQDYVLAQLDKSADLGIEIFELDASWYMGDGKEDLWPNHVGDWFQPDCRYPMGIDGLRDYCHQKGIQFGLWMEPERLGRDSETLAACKDILLSDYREQTGGKSFDSFSDWPGSYQPERMDGGYIDVSKDEGAAWAENRIVRLLDTYQLDYLRIDCNFTPGHLRCQTRRGRYLEDCNYRYYENWYAIFDRLRQRYPNVIFENCAAGGGRTDLGMMQFMSHTQVSDCFITPRTFGIVNGMSICLPPESIDHLVGGCCAHTLAELDFNLRLMLFARPSIGMMNERRYQENPLHWARIKHAVALFKEVMRPMHDSGSQLYHHTPVFYSGDTSGTGVLEYVSGDKTSAVLGVFQLSDPSEKSPCLHFKGLDGSKLYQVTLDNSETTFVLPGHVLLHQGLTVCLEGALTSELILLEAVEEVLA